MRWTGSWKKTMRSGPQEDRNCGKVAHQRDGPTDMYRKIFVLLSIKTQRRGYISFIVVFLLFSVCFLNEKPNSPMATRTWNTGTVCREERTPRSPLCPPGRRRREEVQLSPSASHLFCPAGRVQDLSCQPSGRVSPQRDSHCASWPMCSWQSASWVAGFRANIFPGLRWGKQHHTADPGLAGLPSFRHGKPWTQCLNQCTHQCT